MRALALCFVALGLGCASPPPYSCSTPIDSSGRGLALCRAGTQTPVCDDTGMMAHYEMNAGGAYVLVGGSTAICDDANQVVCTDRSASPHCIEEPLSSGP